MALLRVDPGLVIWLWITFGIILLILRLTVWGRITGALDKRSQKIATDLTSARQAGEKAAAVLAEYDQKIREGKAEAARIIEERAHGSLAAAGGASSSSRTQEAREQMDRAVQEIERAREDAERALRGQVVSLSFSIADAILKRETGTSDNRVFVEEFADKLIAGAPPAPAAAPATEERADDQRHFPQLRARAVRSGRGNRRPPRRGSGPRHGARPAVYGEGRAHVPGQQADQPDDKEEPLPAGVRGEGGLPADDPPLPAGQPRPHGAPR